MINTIMTLVTCFAMMYIPQPINHSQLVRIISPYVVITTIGSDSVLMDGVIQETDMYFLYVDHSNGYALWVSNDPLTCEGYEA